MGQILQGRRWTVSSFPFFPHFRTTFPGTSIPCDSLHSSWPLPSTSSCCFIRCWSQGAQRIGAYLCWGTGWLGPYQVPRTPWDKVLDWGFQGGSGWTPDLGMPTRACVGIRVHLGQSRKPVRASMLSSATHQSHGPGCRPWPL